MCNIYVCISFCSKCWWLFCITVYSWSHYDLVSGTSPTWRHAYPFIRYEKIKLETRDAGPTGTTTSSSRTTREEGAQGVYEVEQGWVNSERADCFSTNCWSPRKRLMRWGVCSLDEKALLEAGEGVAMYTKPVRIPYMWQTTDTDCSSVEYAVCSLNRVYPQESTVANRPLSVHPVSTVASYWRSRNIAWLQLARNSSISNLPIQRLQLNQSWLAFRKICCTMCLCQHTIWQDKLSVAATEMKRKVLC